jgi:hypothetical protein
MKLKEPPKEPQTISDATMKRVFDKALSSKKEARRHLKSIGVMIARDGSVTLRPI